MTGRRDSTHDRHDCDAHVRYAAAAITATPVTAQAVRVMLFPPAILVAGSCTDRRFLSANRLASACTPIHLKKNPPRPDRWAMAGTGGRHSARVAKIVFTVATGILMIDQRRHRIETLSQKLCQWHKVIDPAALAGITRAVQDDCRPRVRHQRSSSCRNWRIFRAISREDAAPGRMQRGLRFYVAG
jgi:hypothetical protein